MPTGCHCSAASELSMANGVCHHHVNCHFCPFIYAALVFECFTTLFFYFFMTFCSRIQFFCFVVTDVVLLVLLQGSIVEQEPDQSPSFAAAIDAVADPARPVEDSEEQTREERLQVFWLVLYEAVAQDETDEVSMFLFTSIIAVKWHRPSWAKREPGMQRAQRNCPIYHYTLPPYKGRRPRWPLLPPRAEHKYVHAPLF